MHELALCQAIVDTVSATPGQPGRAGRGAHRLLPPGRARRAAVLVGAADRRAPTSPAARLVVEHVPGRRRVPGLRRATRRWTMPILLCGACESSDVALRQRRGVPGRLDRPSSGGRADGPLPPPPRRHRPRARPRTRHEHDATTTHATSATTAATSTPAPSGSRCSRTSSPRTTASPTATGPTSPPPACVTVNLMSSPGAGKTTLLKRTLAALGEQVRLGVLEGDIATSLDADELDGLGAAVSLVNTSAGLRRRVPPRRGDGPLRARPAAARPTSTCSSSRTSATSCARPSSTSAQHARAMVYAVTEGEEKPLKYPVMFRAVRRGRGQQDRPAPAPRLRPRRVPRQRAGR